MELNASLVKLISGNKESTTIKTGCRVRILAGKERNCYGTVKSLDEDNGACFVEMDVNRRIIRMGQYNLELMASRKEEGREERDKDSPTQPESKRMRSRSPVDAGRQGGRNGYGLDSTRKERREGGGGDRDRGRQEDERDRDRWRERRGGREGSAGNGRGRDDYDSGRRRRDRPYKD